MFYTTFIYQSDFGKYEVQKLKLNYNYDDNNVIIKNRSKRYQTYLLRSNLYNIIIIGNNYRIFVCINIYLNKPKNI